MVSGEIKLDRGLIDNLTKSKKKPCMPTALYNFLSWTKYSTQQRVLLLGMDETEVEVN